MSFRLYTIIIVNIAATFAAACSSDDSAGTPAGTATATATLTALSATSSAGSAGSGGAAGGGASAPVTGTVTFSAASSGVAVVVSVTGCVSGKSYPIHIHQGTSCTDAAAQGAHWDVPRGEGIPSVVCSGSSGALAMPYTRLSNDAKPWSIGDSTASDMVGHAVVLHDPDDATKRIACGLIVKK